MTGNADGHQTLLYMCFVCVPWSGEGENDDDDGGATNGQVSASIHAQSCGYC